MVSFYGPYGIDLSNILILYSEIKMLIKYKHNNNNSYNKNNL